MTKTDWVTGQFLPSVPSFIDAFRSQGWNWLDLGGGDTEDRNEFLIKTAGDLKKLL